MHREHHRWYNLERGWLQLFCVDSVDRESWHAMHKHPDDCAHYHSRYDAYLRDEVLPLTRHLNDNPFLMTTGARPCGAWTSFLRSAATIACAGTTSISRAAYGRKTSGTRSASGMAGRMTGPTGSRGSPSTSAATPNRPPVRCHN